MKLKIGEFANLSGISVRALHLYDKIKLLCPAYIDRVTGYRYYDPDQLQTLSMIISLKKVGFSLGEIQKINSLGMSTETAIRMLKRKLEENHKIIEICRYNNDNIQAMLLALGCQQKDPENEQTEALRVSRIVCLENEKLEQDFSQILWL